MTEPLCLDFDRHNYRSVVLAGLGTVGGGIMAIGEPYLRDFETVYLLDKDRSCCEKAAGTQHYPVRRMDIEDTEALTGFLNSLESPVLFINACTDVDTIELRKAIRNLPVGYIDICESRMQGNRQGRFTLSMPYTNQPCHGQHPHLICQGSNPGMVEYIARMLIDRMGAEKNSYAVTIYEHDQLTASHSEKSCLVSWSPQDLIDEVMITPSLAYRDERFIEGLAPASRPIMTRWQGGGIPAFQVGHEDIWNLGLLNEVSEARFFYGFSDDIMNILQGDPCEAQNILRLPNENEPIEGVERIVVSVEHLSSGAHQALLWQADHAQTQREYGINAVQYQTAASVLLSVLLMQYTGVGCRAGTYNASTLPLSAGDWDVLWQIVDQLGVNFQPVPQAYVCALEEMELKSW